MVDSEALYKAKNNNNDKMSGVKDMRKSSRQKMTDKNRNSNNNNNIYNNLPDDSDGEEALLSVKNQPKGKKEPSPPPITITDRSLSNVQHIFCGKFPNKFNLKLTSDGIKVFANDMQIHKEIIDFLITSTAYQYYTHRSRDEQLTKFVLHGLHKMEVNDVKASLIEQNIKPFDIKMIPIKNKKFEDQQIYLIYFLKSDKMKLSTLKEIKVINYMRVNFDFYRHKRQGPTQCARCQSFGHGTQHCRKDPKCVRCAGDHKSAECNLISATNHKIPQDSIKCSNCNQNHTANFSKCEARLKFMQRKNRQSPPTQVSNRQHTSSTERHQFRPAPQLNDLNYPSLPKQNQIPPNRTQQLPPVNEQEGPLFSYEQMLPILNEMMTEMSKVKTRKEQVFMMMNLVLKYCSPN